MSEANLWSDVRQFLSPFGFFHRVENKVDLGTPDVAYAIPGASGWLELKHVDHWPFDARSKIIIRGFTKDQVLWLEGWKNAGGRANLLLRVGDRFGTHVLMTPVVARAVYERRYDRKEILDRCNWSEGFIPGRLVKWLSR